MVFVSYSLVTVLVSLAVLQTARTDNIANRNGSDDYDPEKLVGKWYVMDMVGPDVFSPPTCIEMRVRKEENNMFHFTFGGSNPNDKSEQWTAKIEHSEIYKVTNNPNEKRVDFSILDHPNKNEIVLKNHASSTYLLLNRRRIDMSHEIYEKYRKIANEKNYVYREIQQSYCG